MLSLFVGVLMLTGCFRTSVEVPEPPGFGGPTPTGNVRPANSNDKGDVVRENQELRARNAWLERQIDDRQKKHGNLRRDQEKLRDEIGRVQRERARYQ